MVTCLGPVMGLSWFMFLVVPLHENSGIPVFT
jgi:hypothetical protein